MVGDWIIVYATLAVCLVFSNISCFFLNIYLMVVDVGSSVHDAD